LATRSETSSPAGRLEVPMASANAATVIISLRLFKHGLFADTKIWGCIRRRTKAELLKRKHLEKSWYSQKLMRPSDRRGYLKGETGTSSRGGINAVVTAHKRRP
jgi:hypothetical protein